MKHDICLSQNLATGLLKKKNNQLLHFTSRIKRELILFSMLSRIKHQIILLTTLSKIKRQIILFYML